MSFRAARAGASRRSVGHGAGGEQPLEGLGELVGGQPRLVDLARHGEHRLDVGALAQEARVEPPGRHGVLDVVHRVGDVVGPVHDLGLEAPVAVGGAGAEPVEHLEVVVVDAELHRGVQGAAAAPGVLRGGVEAGPGQVQPGRAAVGVGALGLQAGQQAQGLGVALEAADAGRHGRPAPSRRCARTAGGRGRGRGRRCRRRRRCSRGRRRTRGRSGRPRGEWVSRLRTKSSLVGLHDLGLGRQPAQAGGVHQPGPVAGEVVAVGALVGGVLGDPALAVGLGVRHGDVADVVAGSAMVTNLRVRLREAGRSGMVDGRSTG